MTLDRVNVAVVTAATVIMLALWSFIGAQMGHENNLKNRDHWRTCVIIHSPSECRLAIYGGQ